MAESGTTWKFIGLVVFQDTAPKQLVLIAEAIMCSLFSSYGLEIYRDFRPPGLPSVESDISVNRSDPLAPENDDELEDKLDKSHLSYNTSIGKLQKPRE